MSKKRDPHSGSNLLYFASAWYFVMTVSIGYFVIPKAANYLYGAAVVMSLMALFFATNLRKAESKAVEDKELKEGLSNG